MKRRRRIKRWIGAWRRLILFGKMLQDLHERGLTLGTFIEEGAPLTVRRVGFASNDGARAVVIPISKVD